MSWLGTVSIAMLPGEDGKIWRVVSPLAYACDVDGPGEGKIIEVLPNMSTDGASIPRLFWRLIGCPLRGRYAPAAVIHDALYKSQLFSREVADELFREMLLILGINLLKAWAMYKAVRIGGSSSWDRQTQQSIHANRKLVVIT